MIHEIAPHVLDIEMEFSRPQAEDCALFFGEDVAGRPQVMATLADNGSIEFPTCGDFKASRLTYLFAIDEHPHFLVNGHIETPQKTRSPLPRTELLSVRDLIARSGDPQAFAIATGLHLHNWYQDNRFCGRCGGLLAPGTAERALVCTACGHVIYPRISPAVIVAVESEDRLLLTRYARGDYRKRALVAGFVEVGETPEEAVVREVWEECGVRVKDVRYFGSQPWGLSGSLMLGFTASLDGDPTITLQDGELGWAGWIPCDELGDGDGDDYALGRVMIDSFRAKWSRA